MPTRSQDGLGRDPYDHLHPDVRHLAPAVKSIRKACIETDRWVGYPAADDALSRLFELLDMPPRIRMPSVLFWATPNMGKTHIQKRFLELCARRAEAAPGSAASSVFWLELNDGLTEKRLYLDTLRALNVPTPEASATRLQTMVLRQLEARGIRLIILDELQRVTELRPVDQRHVLNVLKYISNQLSISLAGFGSGEARALIKSDLHLAERFDIVALPAWSKKEKWAVDAVRERLSYMPLRKPTNIDRHLMECLFARSNDLLGRMFNLLERSAIAALENEECISPALIEAVALRRRHDENG
jgi:hypothetical protein